MCRTACFADHGPSLVFGLEQQNQASATHVIRRAENELVASLTQFLALLFASATLLIVRMSTKMILHH